MFNHTLASLALGTSRGPGTGYECTVQYVQVPFLMDLASGDARVYHMNGQAGQGLLRQ